MSENVPAVANNKLAVELAEVRSVAKSTATLWAKQWGKLEDMGVDQLVQAAAIIKRAHPHFTEIDIMKYFDFIGGKLRETAEYWLDMASRHPQYNAIHQEPCNPGTRQWQQWMGATDPDAIAAAIITWVFRKDRANAQAEMNYVKKDDPILYDYTVKPLGAKRSPEEAEAKGRAMANDTLQFHASFWSKKSQQYFAKFKTLAPDWPALAMKKARTTSARRALLRSFSLQEARLQVMFGQVDESMAGRHVPLEEVQPVDRPADIASPSISPPPSKRLSDGEVRHTHDDTEETEPFADRPILESDRRKMHVWLNDRVIPSGRAVHDELKTLIAEVQGVDFSNVSTKNVTYRQFEQIRELIEARYAIAVDAKGSGSPDTTTIVNPPGLHSSPAGEGDDRAGPHASPESVPSSPDTVDWEKAIRLKLAKKQGKAPCLHNEHPDYCDLCAQVEDRRIAEAEAKTEGDTPDLFDGPPLDETQTTR